MADFNRDRRGGSRSSGPRRDFGRGGGFSDRGRDREMFQTTCSKCGKACEVPFRPTNGKPVFCRDCFRENGGGDRDNARRDDRRDDRSSNDRGGQDRPSSTEYYPKFKEQFESLNYKLDKILRILETATQPEKSAEFKQSKKEKVVPEEEVSLTPEEVAPVVKKKKAKKEVVSESPEESTETV